MLPFRPRATERGGALRADLLQPASLGGTVGGGPHLPLELLLVVGGQHEQGVHPTDGEGRHRLPVVREVLADVVQRGGGARGHALAEVVREAGQGLRRQSQRLEARERESHVGAPVRRGVPLQGGGDRIDQAGQPPAGGPGVGEPVEEVGGTGHAVTPQHEALDVAAVQDGGHLHRPGATR